MKRHVVVIAALWVGVVVAGIGCNLIVDASGYKVSDAGASSEGDSGAVEEEAGPVACGQGLATGADFNQLVESCVLAVSCDPDLFDVTLATCLTYDYLHSREAYSCLAGAHTCADFYQCEFLRRATVTDCPNAGASSKCTGRLAINCVDQGSGSVLDCTSLGGTCSTALGTADCVDDVPCTQTDDQKHCTANNAEYTCIDGVGYGVNCGSGFTCGESDSDAGAGCFFNAPTCASPTLALCNGGSAEYCTEGRQLFSFNCGLSGSSCVLTDGGSQYFCISKGCTTDSVDRCTESCASDGKTLETCIGGAPYAIDCTKYADFTACAQSTDTSTTPSTTYTYCE
jgi:hypothetical protein